MRSRELELAVPMSSLSGLLLLQTSPRLPVLGPDLKVKSPPLSETSKSQAKAADIISMPKHGVSSTSNIGQDRKRTSLGHVRPVAYSGYALSPRRYHSILAFP